MTGPEQKKEPPSREVNPGTTTKTPSEALTARSKVGRQVVEALIPAGEADEHRGLTLHLEGRDEQALQHFEAAAREGRPVALFFVALIKRPQNLEDFLKNIEDLFASFLEIALPNLQIDQHLPIILKKLRDAPPQITNTATSGTQPLKPITTQTLLENMTTFLKNHGKPSQQMQAIKTITALLEALTTPQR